MQCISSIESIKESWIQIEAEQCITPDQAQHSRDARICTGMHCSSMPMYQDGQRSVLFAFLALSVQADSFVRFGQVRNQKEK